MKICDLDAGFHPSCAGGSLLIHFMNQICLGSPISDLLPGPGNLHFFVHSDTGRSGANQ